MNTYMQILLWGIIGGLVSECTARNWEDVQKDQQHYCEMVEEQTYPDYKGIYQNECPQGDRNHGNE